MGLWPLYISLLLHCVDRLYSSKHGAFTQYCFNVRPSSSTLGQHWNSSGWMPGVCWDIKVKIWTRLHCTIIRTIYCITFQWGYNVGPIIGPWPNIVILLTDTLCLTLASLKVGLTLVYCWLMFAGLGGHHSITRGVKYFETNNFRRNKSFLSRTVLYKHVIQFLIFSMQPSRVEKTNCHR